MCSQIRASNKFWRCCCFELFRCCFLWEPVSYPQQFASFSGVGMRERKGWRRECCTCPREHICRINPMRPKEIPELKVRKRPERERQNSRTLRAIKAHSDLWARQIPACSLSVCVFKKEITCAPAWVFFPGCRN